jgi:NTP pyrophosphatase (non-canonical NTP hydrolase)
MKDIDQYGDYTVQRWFSGGDVDRDGETFAEKGAAKSLTIMSLGLAGEVGEVIENIKKIFRDGTVNEDALKKELGDAQFYLVRLMRYFGWQSSEVIAANIEKLDSRLARGTMRGSGDYR